MPRGDCAEVLTRPVTGGRAAGKNRTIGSLGPRLGAEIGIGSKIGGKPRPLYIGTYAAQSPVSACSIAVQLANELENISACIQNY